MSSPRTAHFPKLISEFFRDRYEKLPPGRAVVVCGEDLFCINVLKAAVIILRRNCSYNVVDLKGEM